MVSRLARLPISLTDGPLFIQPLYFWHRLPPHVCHPSHITADRCSRECKSARQSYPLAYHPHLCKSLWPPDRSPVDQASLSSFPRIQPSRRRRLASPGGKELVVSCASFISFRVSTCCWFVSFSACSSSFFRWNCSLTVPLRRPPNQTPISTPTKASATRTPVLIFDQMAIRLTVRL